MKYFDAFAGIGGFALGIQQAYENIQCSERFQQGRVDKNGNLPNTGESRLATQPLCIGFSEIDRYAIQVYQSHFPTHKNYGSISEIDWNTVPDFDLLTGGSPCQDLSIAGKRAGLGGERSGLFEEYVRALKEKKPQYFVWENVKGALSSNQGWDFVSVINSFTEAGYDVQWQVLNSKNFGVPQNRERIFVVGSRGKCAREVFFEREGTDVGLGKDGQGNAYCLQAGGDKHRGTYIKQLNNPTHSNNRVYGAEVISPTLNTAQGGNRQPFVSVPEATKKGYAVAHEGDSINLSFPNSKTRRGRVGVGVAQTLDAGMQQHTLQRAMIRRLTPGECMKLQGFPPDWCDVVSDSQKYKCAGNAVTVNVIEAIMGRLLQ